MSREADWVRARHDLAFICERCGDVQPMPSPCDLDVYVAASKAYVAKHKHCRPKEESHG